MGSNKSIIDIVLQKKYNFDIVLNSVCHSKTNELPNCGEDGLMIYNKINSNFSVFGIADGIGGIKQQYGIDPSKFSNGLMNNLYQYFLQKKIKDLKTILLEIFVKLTREKIIGASTICVNSFNKNNGKLNILNLGDCSIMILRKKRKNYVLKFKSKIQQRGFNSPLNLSNISRNDIINSDLKNSLNYKIQLEIGDILIVGSDGLWDNLHDNEIINIVNQFNIVKENDIKNISKYLLKKILYLFKNIHKPMRHGPFTKNAQKNNVSYKLHSKIDDISIIVGIIL